MSPPYGESTRGNSTTHTGTWLDALGTQPQTRRKSMQVMHLRCAGLDVHKKTVVACVMISQPDGGVEQYTATFGTMTPDILGMSDWLKGHGVTHAAMESTGVYWRPIYQLLEGQFTLLVANAQHIHRMPGRKTDVTDAQWLVDLLRHGLITPSFVPPQAQRELRELTRHRSNVAGRRAQCINEVHRTLEGTNIKLSSVATDITGKSATDMLEHLLAGQSDPEVLAELARGVLRKKIPQLRQALQGVVRAHQQLILSQLLADIAACDEEMLALNAEIAGRLTQEQEILERLDEIPGVNRRVAEVIVAELGTDMKRFGSASRAAAWSGMCPANRQSGGRTYRARSRFGNKHLKSALTEAGRAAGRSKETYLGAQYRRITVRRGGKRAALAVGHSILTI
ncbi:MAG TPA: IS110 family transposase, partial [Candidatus Dormibacteraeota bacterium]|nr:IS110 family transposase [Candidatus Dormibacteraeota bacterium]